MHDLVTLLVAFAASFVAAIGAALLFRAFGKKPDYFLATAVAVGVTVATAIRLVRPISDAAFPLILGIVVALSVLGAKIATKRHSV